MEVTSLARMAGLPHLLLSVSGVRGSRLPCPAGQGPALLCRVLSAAVKDRPRMTMGLGNPLS